MSKNMQERCKGAEKNCPTFVQSAIVFRNSPMFRKIVLVGSPGTIPGNTREVCPDVALLRPASSTRLRGNDGKARPRQGACVLLFKLAFPGSQKKRSQIFGKWVVSEGVWEKEGAFNGHVSGEARITLLFSNVRFLRQHFPPFEG